MLRLGCEEEEALSRSIRLKRSQTRASQPILWPLQLRRHLQQLLKPIGRIGLRSSLTRQRELQDVAERLAQPLEESRLATTPENTLLKGLSSS